jgi:hypothetical protein
MATSSTYDFNPSFGDLTMNAFARIRLRRTELTPQHLADAALESNLVQVELSSKQPNLWSAELYEVPLTDGVGSYDLLPRFVSPMAVYLTTDTGNGNTFDRVLWPISTYEWSALPNKTQQAPPTSYWFQRAITPVMHLWPVPDANATYTLKLRILSQLQDASLRNGTTPNLPYRWMDWFAARLAHRLSRIYAPELEAARKADAIEAWQNAATEDIEYTPTYLIPMIGGYSR